MKTLFDEAYNAMAQIAHPETGLETCRSIARDFLDDLRTTKTKDPILPCPFCGGVDFLIVDPLGGGDSFSVECQKCSCCLGVKSTEDAAIKLWNTRT